MKYALITGGTRGIGLQCCKAFAGAGYAVTALYSNEGEDADRARAALPGITFRRADVSDEDAVREAFSALPALDVLVCNAGISLFGQVQDLMLKQWEKVMAVNAGGVFLCAKYAVKKFLARGEGSIVNIGSVWGETGGSCESAYSASKGAVIAFTKALAKELAPSHIRVNCVSPGVVDTGMNAHLKGEERRALEEEIPLGRFASAEEVAAFVLRVAETPYLTGQDIGLNGGFFI